MDSSDRRSALLAEGEYEIAISRVLQCVRPYGGVLLVVEGRVVEATVPDTLQPGEEVVWAVLLRDEFSELLIENFLAALPITSRNREDVVDVCKVAVRRGRVLRAIHLNHEKRLALSNEIGDCETKVDLRAHAGVTKKRSRTGKELTVISWKTSEAGGR